MGKYRDHRQPRSDRFENDDGTHSEPNYFQSGSETRATAPPTASAMSPVIAAEVLWFNAEKGFGFIRLRDGSEAFLHVSKLQAVGQTSLPEGAKLQVLVEVSAKGKPQVSQLVSMASGQEAAVAPHLPNPAPQRTGEEEGLGSVTRYYGVKGFGFIRLEKGGNDVFVHATSLTRSGLTSLNVGQAVLVRYGQGPKGLEARTVRVM
jgi:cold shock protein